MLDIENLNVCVDGKKILKGFGLKINPGEVHAIMGPNGSGKSTLANALTGKNGYEINGKVLYEGKDLLKAEEKELIEILKIVSEEAVLFSREKLKEEKDPYTDYFQSRLESEKERLFEEDEY